MHRENFEQFETTLHDADPNSSKKEQLPKRSQTTKKLRRCSKESKKQKQPRFISTCFGNVSSHQLEEASQELKQQTMMEQLKLSQNPTKHSTKFSNAITLTSAKLLALHSQHHHCGDQKETRTVKLRTTHLFEADHNWLLGLVFGCCMACIAEDQQRSSDSQWGACLDCSTEQPDLCQTVSCEISRLTRTPFGTLDNDAKVCCDRIVLVFVLMTAWRTSVCVHDGRNSTSHSTTLDQNRIWRL